MFITPWQWVASGHQGLFFDEMMRHSVEHSLPLHEAEKAVIGVDHGLAGALLAKRWTFSGQLVDCIRDHHNPRAEPCAMMDCLRVADQAVRFREIGDSGNPWRENEAPAAPGRFGDDMDAIIGRLGSLDKIVEDAMMFAQVGNEQ